MLEEEIGANPIRARRRKAHFCFSCSMPQIEDKPLGNREGEKQVPSRNILQVKLSVIRCGYQRGEN